MTTGTGVIRQGRAFIHLSSSILTEFYHMSTPIGRTPPETPRTPPETPRTSFRFFLRVLTTTSQDQSRRNSTRATTVSERKATESGRKYSRLVLHGNLIHDLAIDLRSQVPSKRSQYENERRPGVLTNNGVRGFLRGQQTIQLEILDSLPSLEHLFETMVGIETKTT